MIWPDYAAVEASGYGVARDSDVQRTPWEDGAARQSKTATAAFTVRKIKVHLASDADHVRFRAWTAANAHAWFTWRDPDDGMRRRARVRGGDGGIDDIAIVSAAGTRRWEATMELEGLWSDVVA